MKNLLKRSLIGARWHRTPNYRLRELTTAEIGKLVSVTGVVTRTSEVRPELLQGTFKCLECGNVIKNVEQQFKYTEVCSCKLIDLHYFQADVTLCASYYLSNMVA